MDFYTSGIGHEFIDVPAAHVFIYIPKSLSNTDHLRSPWCFVIIVSQTACPKTRISHAIEGVQAKLIVFLCVTLPFPFSAFPYQF
jgi:hypothetical protein